MGYTPIHIAAKYGHLELIDKVKIHTFSPVFQNCFFLNKYPPQFSSSNVNLRQVSRKTGLSALHIAAYFGEEGAYFFEKKNIAKHMGN